MFKSGCFGYPSNCVASKSCTILVTFVQQVENGAVDFNLIFSTMTNRYADKYFHTVSATAILPTTKVVLISPLQIKENHF